MTRQQKEDEDRNELKNSVFNSGKHCAKPDCRSLDFLPLTCPHCQLVFCGPHAPVFYHDCIVQDSVSFPANSRPQGSTSSTIDPVQELVSSHTPDSPAPTDDSRNAKARQILASRFPAPRERQPARSTKELSPALKLILLKRKATSGDPRKKDGDVPPADRWYGHLTFCVPTSDPQGLTPDELRKTASEPRAVWFHKKTVTGKVLDLTIEMFRSQLVATSSSVSPSDLQLIVIRPNSQSPVLISAHCSRPWGELVEQGEEVWLTGRILIVP